MDPRPLNPKAEKFWPANLNPQPPPNPNPQPPPNPNPMPIIRLPAPHHTYNMRPFPLPYVNPMLLPAPHHTYNMRPFPLPYVNPMPLPAPHHTYMRPFPLPYGHEHQQVMPLNYGVIPAGGEPYQGDRQPIIRLPAPHHTYMRPFPLSYGHEHQQVMPLNYGVIPAGGEPYQGDRHHDIEKDEDEDEDEDEEKVPSLKQNMPVVHRPKGSRFSNRLARVPGHTIPESMNLGSKNRSRQRPSVNTAVESIVVADSEDESSS